MCICIHYPAADNGNRNLLETNCYCLLLIAHCPSSTPTCLNTTFQSGENDQTTLNWKFVHSSFSTPSDNSFPMIFKWENLETLPSVEVQSKAAYTNSWRLKSDHSTQLIPHKPVSQPFKNCSNENFEIIIARIWKNENLCGFLRILAFEY